VASSFDIILCDMQPALIRAWEEAFALFPEVAIEPGDLLEVEADAYVSPANSYGIMDGGIDLVLSTRFPRIEKRVQEAIAAVDILLPVGQALVVETDDGYVPYLVCAPTMEVPSHVGHTNNAFRAMLALLKAVEKFNEVNEEGISSVGIPGLCTGVGGMEPVAAQQMALAYAEWSGQ
jgi:O-acetyl-ADP-ribose deacetylase (regulator of RNase III)